MKAEKLRNAVKTVLMVSEILPPDYVFKQIDEELEAIESKAYKLDDPQTQADLKLAAAVKAAFKKQSTLEIPCGDGNIEMIYQKFELLDWYREQKGGNL